jgi:uncharacterized protein
MSNSRLLKAKVWHLREKPKRNEFTYSVYYLAHELKAEDTGKPRLLSFDSFNILSLYKKDLGAKDGSDWLSWITVEFQKANISINEIDTIEIISHPRLFGYAFNPISFWILLNESKDIRAVLCEVHNTFRGHHNYLLSNTDGSFIQPKDIFTTPKKLYVSPFNTMEGYYTFSFLRNEKMFKSDIIYHVGDEAVVRTAMTGSYSKLTDFSILGVVFSYPLMTIMVVVRIHWQAVRLYFKKVSFTLKQRPKKNPGGTSLGNKK